MPLLTNRITRPALILHRRFWDGANDLFAVSRTIFPASRFTFEMRFSRNLRGAR
ncbi:hypothetical protein [Rhodovibrio salinarum]|uniref:hypothetical protein n=1 Tax=Rhodovibrio salinarum TaxID=1087 RepID=UPI0004B6CEC4|nr:hypothetical protein [Rhodovibrio salinarum]